MRLCAAPVRALPGNADPYFSVSRTWQTTPVRQLEKCWTPQALWSIRRFCDYHHMRPAHFRAVSPHHRCPLPALRSLPRAPHTWRGIMSRNRKYLKFSLTPWCRRRRGRAGSNRRRLRRRAALGRSDHQSVDPGQTHAQPHTVAGRSRARRPREEVYLWFDKRSTRSLTSDEPEQVATIASSGPASISRSPSSSTRQ